MTNLTVLVLLAPLLGFVILGVAGSALTSRAIITVAWGGCGLAFLFATISFFSMLGTPVAARTSDQVFYTWVSSGTFQLSFGLYLDPLSATMLMIVTGVGLLIHIYSAGYMKEMVLLVSADNFLFLLVGWGLVGLASFLLIGFWYRRPRAVAAAQKALVVNIIGDFGFMIAIFLIFKEYGVLNFYNNASGNGVFSILNPASSGTMLQTIIALCLFIACAAKSAQLPLYMWLPDAMEGPTPVSALIHAATMVTAGVYLVARAHPLFELSPTALTIIALIGGLTAIFAASIAIFQLDIKRVLAYSTISQLGYMFMAEGVHNYTAGIFHLTTHAYFKALLFLCAGAVIHALDGEQDMRQMGGLRDKLTITFWTFLLAALAISGIPPLSGFWSKDEILSSLLAQATVNNQPLSYVLWGIGIITAGLTAFYIFRLFYGIFQGDYRGTGQSSHAQDEDEEEPSRHTGRLRIHEAPAVMTVPLIILAFLSCVGGLVGSFAIIGFPQWDPIGNFLAPVFADVHTMATASLGVQWTSTVLSVGIGLLGILAAWRIYGRGFQYKENDNQLYQLVLHKYYVDEILDAVIVQPILWSGRTATRLLEGELLDAGGQAVAGGLRGISTGLRRLQTGYVRNYALAILIGVLLIILYYAVRG
ncbi:MAG: NADH-quinone oxidoreductase subunit L [Chloroflexi bacterium]|nr:MAG: NADH-quinone oxidoreductase subunit L [Chloroflexota bacterium]